MAPRLRPLSVVARALAALTAALVVPLSMPAAAGADYVAWGSVLVPGSQWAGTRLAALGDLNVYSNGNGNQDQVSTFGLSYECVELAQRYAAVRYGEQKLWPVSFAYQMWGVAPTLQVPFLQNPNGGAKPPQAGDLLIFDHTGAAPFGHVAVVADVGPDYVNIVEQNWGNLNPVGGARLPLSGTTMPARYGVPIIGWLRASTAAIPYKPVIITGAGQVYSDAGATSYGGPVTLVLSRPVVGATGTPTGKGYWMVAGDGGVFTYGDAQFSGSTGGMRLNQPVVGMASTPSGKGYWLVASDGGIFTFGDAVFYGSTGALKLNKPVVGMASTPSGKGYWLVASDGGIFSFGDAAFRGSTGNIKLNQPINGMAATASGNGYWMVASDGGIFTFGDAPFLGSTGGITVPSPVARMAPTSDGNGYWLATTGGTVYAFGNAKWLANTGLVQATTSPVVGLVTTLSQQ
jgi:hypothetical protein